MERRKNNHNPIIGIIGGKGRMGKLFAAFFRERGIEVLISDLDTKLSNEELAGQCDIVIVSVPIDVTEKTIKKILPFVRAESALMDFTSLKSAPLKAMLQGRCEVMGMHPMFGDSNPVPGQTMIICPTKKSGKWSEWMREFLQKNNVKIEGMGAKEHDRMMTIAQGMIHFAEMTFADALRRTKTPIKEIVRYTGKASELKIILAARLINQDPYLYANIQLANPDNLKILKSYQKSIDELTKIVKKKDLKGFVKYFEGTKKCFGSYMNDAYNESGYLIDKLLEKRSRPLQIKETKPGKKDLALLGPAKTYSDEATSKYLQLTNQKLKKYYCKNIPEIFELVADGKVALGIAPVENQLNGTVRETLDSLFEQDVQIVKEISLPIDHCLITLKHSDPKQIQTIISHPQALEQCAKYLAKHFPKANIEPYSSTAAAVDKLLISKKVSVAVIASKIAGTHPELKIIADEIQDNKNNSTRFIVIQKGKFQEKNIPANAKKTSIIFHFAKNKPGSLYEVFQEFAKEKVDLSKIESRPTKSQFGEYIFFLDFNEPANTVRGKRVLKSIAKKVAKLKILGSY